MKKSTLLQYSFPLFILILLASGTFAQQRKISGIVQESKNNAPLDGATVSVKNSKANAITKDDGRFELSVPEGKNTLVVSFVGYETTTISVGANQNSVLIKMNESGGTQMGEVVIVGYQKQTLRKSTSSVQIISGKEIENLPAPSFDALLQGKVSGVNIQNFSGEPGVRNTFTVRGNSTISTDLNAGGNDNRKQSANDEARSLSTPLYVIDGIPVSVNDIESVASSGTNVLAGININDIESIVVQKDAAATAAWGSRGANGVIVIKTKRGRTGSPQIRLSYYTGVVKKPELLRTVVGAEERHQKLDLMKEYGTFNQLSQIPQLLSDSLNPAFNNATDWQDLFYQTGSVNNADVNISAGNEVLNYRVGANFYDEKGIVRNTGFKRYSLRGNFDFKIAKHFNAILNFSASRLDRKRGLGRGRDNILPIDGVRQPASFYAISQTDKDFYYGQYDQQRDQNLSDIFSTYIQLNYDISKAVQYSFQGSVSNTNDKRDRFQPTEITDDHRSFASSENGNYQEIYLANILTASKSFKEKTHNFNAVLTQSFQLYKKTGSYIYCYNVPDNNIQIVSGIPQKDLEAYSVFQQAGLFSLLGQLSYDYKGKYIINASYRGDASSRFGANTRWGYFPAISAAWVVSDEKFMDRFKFIDIFKLRGSYGLSGSLPDDFYAPFNVWDLQQGFYNGVTIATPSFFKPITQPNLTWNKSNQANIGVDLYMFKNRVNITVDAYRRYNTNPILDFPFPFFTGYNSVVANAPVKILNEGVDLQIQTRNLSSKSAFQWTTNLNMTFNRNRITQLPNGNRSFFKDSRNYNEQLIYAVGAPIYGWTQMLYSGVYSHLNEIPVNPLTGQRLSYFKTYQPVQPGYPIWKDVNHDWDVWSDEDRGEQFGDLVATGNPNPKITGGFYNEFSYKNFSVGILATYTIGRDIINNFESNQFNNVWNFGNINDFARNRLPDLSKYDYWTPTKAENPNYRAGFPSLNPYGGHFYEFLPFSTLWNENGTYVKIKNVTLGYSFNQNVVKRLGIQTIRLYSIIDNLYSFQKSNVPDAELVSPQGEYSGAAYPLPRKFTFGFDITF